MSFWGELKRRNVFKVGAAYVIAAWLIVQVANTFFPILHLPEWTVTFIAALLILGLPVALILAWAYEMTPEGVKLTKKVPLAESITHVTGRRLNYVLVGLIIVLVGYIVILQFFIGKPNVQTDVASTEAEQTPASADVEEAPKTVAVLPFDNLSSDPEQEYFVDGLSEELLNSLTKIPELRVIAKTSSFAFKGKDKTIQEIADVLGADHILEGSVRKAGNSLRITAQLIRAADGIHLWSETYDRELKDIFAIQEDIATTVANELKVTLGVGKSLKQSGGTENEEAYEIYLFAQGQCNAGDIYLAIKSIDEAIEIDHEFGLAWVLKAKIHYFIAIDSPTNRVASEYESALKAAQRAIELEPNLAEAYDVLGSYRSATGDWIDAELAFRKALELKKDQILTGTAEHYQRVGYFGRANEIFKEIRRNDPLNSGIRMNYIINLGLMGDTQGAEEEYERCTNLFGESWAPWSITYLRLDAYDVLSRDKILDSDLIDDTAKEYLDSPEKGLTELRRIYDDYDNLTDNNLIDMSMWAAYFGDPEFAMDAMEKGFSLDPSITDTSSMWTVWLPHMRKVRQTPRFKALVKKIGLVDYWNEFGWPDLCKPTGDGDFICE